MGKKCFVISPIGASGSDIREHADDVFEFITKPAMDELGIHVYRGDHSQEIGRITERLWQYRCIRGGLRRSFPCSNALLRSSALQRRRDSEST